MADKKLNTGPAENISPEAAEPIATPEQAAASEPQQEQTGPAIPESGDVVVSFDKINELMNEKRQTARGRSPIRRNCTSPEVSLRDIPFGYGSVCIGLRCNHRRRETPAYRA